MTRMWVGRRRAAAASGLARHLVAARALVLHLLAASHLRLLRGSNLGVCDTWKSDRQRDRSHKLVHCPNPVKSKKRDFTQRAEAV